MQIINVINHPSSVILLNTNAVQHLVFVLILEIVTPGDNVKLPQKDAFFFLVNVMLKVIA